MKTRRYLLVILLLSFSSCGIYHYFSVKDRSSESNLLYNRFLLKNGIDTTYSYQLAVNYKDSLSLEKYAINLYKLKSGGKAAPIQIRLYSPDGRLLNGYEFCFGDINKFSLLDSLPMKKVPWLPINYNLNLYNDLNLLNISNDERTKILLQKDKHRFVIIAMYSVWVNWYSKHVLGAVNGYINKYGKENFLFIKVNTSP